MTLIEVIRDIDTFDENEVIYAKPPFNSNSIAEINSNSERPNLSELKYVLEVAIAREVLEVWSQWRDGVIPSNEQGLEAILYYAEHDSYLPC